MSMNSATPQLLEVDVAVKICFQEPEVPEEREAPVGTRVTEDEREVRGRRRGAVLGAVDVAHDERGAGALGDRAEHGIGGGSQAAGF